MMMFVSMLARDIGVCPATRASRMQACLPRCLIRDVCACGRSVAAFPSLVRTWYNELDRSTATRVDKFVAAAISPVCLQPWIPNPAVYIHTLLLEHTSVCPVFRVSGFGCGVRHRWRHWPCPVRTRTRSRQPWLRHSGGWWALAARAPTQQRWPHSRRVAACTLGV